MARLKRRGKGKVYYAWVPRPEGGTRLVSTNCTDRQAAALRAAVLEREALAPADAAARGALLEDACESFLASRRARGRADGTLHHYGVKLSHICELLPKRLADVTHAACEEYIKTRKAEGVQQTTIKKELRALGAVLRYARKNGKLSRAPEEIIPELEETYKPRTRALTPWEMVGLVSALPQERAAHVAFIVATGARWSESIKAEPRDVGTECVRLRGTKTDAAERLVPFTPVSRSMVKWACSRAKATPKMFAPWGNVRRDLAKACDLAGIDPVTPNDLRRTFGTWLRNSGIEPHVIGAAMGHVDSRMVELVYGRLTPEALGRLLNPVRLMSGSSVDSGTLPSSTVTDQSRETL